MSEPALKLVDPDTELADELDRVQELPDYVATAADGIRAHIEALNVKLKTGAAELREQRRAMTAKKRAHAEVSQCVILFRNPNNGAVGFISRGDGENEYLDGEIEVFESEESATELAMRHPLLRHFPYQIVELDGL